MATWAELHRGEPEGFAIHIDPSSIRRSNSRVRMWVLFDYKTVRVIGNQPYMSERAQDEYDCKEERVRLLGFSDHSGNMAGGKVVHRTFVPGDWAPVEPGSVNEMLWKVACAKQ